MKKYLSIFIAILIIGACVTTDANAKRRTRTPRAATTAVSTVEKDDFAGYWHEISSIHGYQVDIRYDPETDTFTGTLCSQIEEFTGVGKLVGNTINFKCSGGNILICTLKGDILHGTYKNNRYHKGKARKTKMSLAEKY